jgi:septation ring formation regulator EzrA
VICCGQNSTELLALKSIEDDIKKLENKISQIEANGEEKRFLFSVLNDVPTYA